MNLRTKLLMSVSATALTVCISSPTISQTYYSFGNSTYSSDGYSAHRYGNITYGSDGTTAFSYGNSTYGSDGYSSHSYGNMTYGSDGTTCITIGNTSFCNWYSIVILYKEDINI